MDLKAFTLLKKCLFIHNIHSDNKYGEKKTFQGWFWIFEYMTLNPCLISSPLILVHQNRFHSPNEIQYDFWSGDIGIRLASHYLYKQRTCIIWNETFIFHYRWQQFHLYDCVSILTISITIIPLQLHCSASKPRKQCLAKRKWLCRP